MSKSTNIILIISMLVLFAVTTSQLVATLALIAVGVNLIALFS